jgi:hypothetical protein
VQHDRQHRGGEPAGDDAVHHHAEAALETASSMGIGASIG